jgi:hypothetical protein
VRALLTPAAESQGYDLRALQRIIYCNGVCGSLAEGRFLELRELENQDIMTQHSFEYCLPWKACVDTLIGQHLCGCPRSYLEISNASRGDRPNLPSNDSDVVRQSNWKNQVHLILEGCSCDLLLEQGNEVR